MKRPLLKILFLFGLLALGVALGRYYHLDVNYFRAMFDGFPIVLSGLIFITLYIVSTTFILVGPKDVMRISGAIIFGPVVSTVFVWFGEIGNACVLFSLSRSLGREYVEKRFKLKPQALRQVQDKGWGFLSIFAMRINPLCPFRIMDLSFGLTSVSFRKYLTICLFGSIPRIFWLQYIIHGVGENMFKDLDAITQYMQNNAHVILYSAIYFLIIIILSLVAVVRSFLRKRRKTRASL